MGRAPETKPRVEWELGCFVRPLRCGGALCHLAACGSHAVPASAFWGKAGRGDDIITGAWPEDILPAVCMHWGPNYCMEGLGEVARVAWG